MPQATASPTAAQGTVQDTASGSAAATLLSPYLGYNLLSLEKFPHLGVVDELGHILHELVVRFVFVGDPIPLKKRWEDIE
jgi:hypothetical protein